MHELSVCRRLLQTVERLAAQQGADRVSRVEVRIGPLSGIVPELLESAFPVARQGTVAETARLVVENSPLLVRCPDCGEQPAARLSDLRCPACHNRETRLISGDELLLTGIQIPARRARNHV